MEKEEEKQQQAKKTTTGIDFLDLLIPEERKEALAKAKMHWDSLTQSEKVEYMNLLYDLVREK